MAHTRGKMDGCRAQSGTYVMPQRRLANTTVTDVPWRSNLGGRGWGGVGVRHPQGKGWGGAEPGVKECHGGKGVMGVGVRGGR